MFFGQAGNNTSSNAMLGAISGNSACHYSYRLGTSYSITSVARSLGWHQFRIVWGGGAISLYIDGSFVASSLYSYQPDSVSLGDVWAETLWLGTSAGWFDDLSISVTVP